MRKRVGLWLGLAAVLAAAAAAKFGWDEWKAPERLMRGWVERPDDGASITYPFDGALFPADIAAPTFRWTGKRAGTAWWWLWVSAADGRPVVSRGLAAAEWRPDPETWQAIKEASLGAPVAVTVIGVATRRSRDAVCGSRIRIRTSPDRVDALIFYRDVPLPFLYAVKNPETIRWRLGDVSSEAPAPVVLQNLPVCGNCHSFSRDGLTLGMDVDYANDKGSYAITPLSRTTLLDRSRVITWNDYRRADGLRTYGLLSQVSPDGRYVVSTVKDRSIFMPKDDAMYSQLFFPIRGILAVYDRVTKTFESLPGADDPRYVQSNASWSPDGQALIFARAPAIDLRRDERTGEFIVPQRLEHDFITGSRGFQFDLYRIPFNSGRGGNAVPVTGAATNGMSNYFARMSPDGRWIVFSMARNYMLLQPDSALYILPAAGGQPRRMTCNTPDMNSWHSWSPNGKWLVFASKLLGPYTQLCLTHVDERGQDTPPIILERMGSPGRAANIPEFVGGRAGGLQGFEERFLGDYNFHRRADEMAQVYADLPRAEANYRAALAISPTNAEIRAKLGQTLLKQGKSEAAENELRRAAAQEPPVFAAHLSLARFYRQQGDAARAVKELSSLVRRWPGEVGAHQEYSLALYDLHRLDEAEREARAAILLDESRPELHLNLGVFLEDRGERAASLAEYRRALRFDPTQVEMGLQVARRLLSNADVAAEAVALLGSILASNADCAPAHIMLGQQALDAGRWKESLEHFQAAQRSDPEAAWLQPKIDELTAEIRCRGEIGP